MKGEQSPILKNLGGRSGAVWRLRAASLPLQKVPAPVFHARGPVCQRGAPVSGCTGAQGAAGSGVPIFPSDTSGAFLL
jgi:hypothetical protein